MIEPPKGFSLPSVRELWRDRELVYILARREVSVRYKQSVIGVFWVLLQPLLLALVFSVFFGKLAHIPSEAGVPYALFALSGMVMWLFVSVAITRAAESLVLNKTLISKVYFPRTIVPLAAVFPPLVDFCIGFVVVLGAMFVYGTVPPIQILLMPLVVVLALATATGVGLWLSALNVRYRDISQAIPFVVMLGLFVSPITYPFHLVPHDVRAIYEINPMVGILEIYRWMLFPNAGWPGPLVPIPIVESVVLLLTGAAYYQRSESAFADVI